MSKKKTEKVIGNIELVCNKSKWTGFKPSCERILSVQNCLHFFGDYQACECFEMRELDIRERELERIEQMIILTEDLSSIEKDDIEVKVVDEPPLEDKPKKKRKRRKRKNIEDPTKL